jgi:hypothetical protein
LLTFKKLTVDSTKGVIMNPSIGHRITAGDVIKAIEGV